MLPLSEKLRLSAYAHYAHHDYWSAIADCYRAITSAPGLAWPYVLLGKCYLAIGRNKEAVALLKRSLQLMPSYSIDAMEQVQKIIDMEKPKCQ